MEKLRCRPLRLHMSQMCFQICTLNFYGFLFLRKTGKLKKKIRIIKIHQIREKLWQIFILDVSRKLTRKFYEFYPFFNQKGAGKVL